MKQIKFNGMSKIYFDMTEKPLKRKKKIGTPVHKIWLNINLRKKKSLNCINVFFLEVSYNYDQN